MARRLVPREGGVLGIAGSSILYGVAYTLARGDPGPLLALGLAGALLSLALTGPAWASPPGAARLRLMAAPAALYLAVVAARAPDSLPFAAASLALALAAARAEGLSLVGVGGPLVATTGGLVALAGGAGPVEALLPTAYALLTVPLASIVVTRDRVAHAVPAALGGLAVLASGVGLCLSGCGLAGGVLLLDALARLAIVPLGVYERLPPAAYGYHEAARTTVILLVAATCP